MPINAKVLAQDVPWQDCYPVVEGFARQYLATLDATDTISTNDLTEALWPEKQAIGDGIYARKRVTKALVAMASKSMSDCCYKGEPERLPRVGTMIQRWKWHVPTGIKYCECCGQQLPTKEVTDAHT